MMQGSSKKKKENGQRRAARKKGEVEDEKARFKIDACLYV